MVFKAVNEKQAVSSCNKVVNYIGTFMSDEDKEYMKVPEPSVDSPSERAEWLNLRSTISKRISKAVMDSVKPWIVSSSKGSIDGIDKLLKCKESGMPPVIKKIPKSTKIKKVPKSNKIKKVPKSTNKIQKAK